MIVEKDTDVEQFGALKGRAVAMDFAADAKGHLMDILAKGLYGRPKEAVLREYSTNALDAQIEVGVTRPIEVTLPTPMAPVLRIRDFGVGLDMEGIETVYSQYGASTKRQSNDFNGTLGLGGKSAFAYSNRFTVVSIKGGIRIEVAVTRNEDGTAEMVVVDQRPTAEDGGTEVQVPCKRGDDFDVEARKLFQWFPAGSVKVNGTLQQSWRDTDEGAGALEVAPGMFVVDHRSRGYSYGAQDDLIVMGNIAYPAKLDTSLNRRTHHLVCYVPNGSVRFTPSRETLAENSVTRGKLAELAATFNTAIIDTVQKHIDAAPSKPEAAAVVANWQDVVPANAVPPGGYEYKGEAIPLNVTVGQSEPNIRHLPLLKKSGYHNGHARLRSVGLTYFSGTLWVKGFTPDQVTASHAQKARQYVADNGLSMPNGIVLIHAIPTEVEPWLGTVITYDDLKKVKLPRNYTPGSSGRIPGSYDLHTTEASVLSAHKAQSPYYADAEHVTKEGVPAETFRHWKAPLFFAVGNRHDTNGLCDALHYVQGAKGFTLVVMRADRVAKFRRNFPAALDALDAVREGFKTWQATTDGDAVLGMAIQSDWSARNLRALKNHVGQIADPDLAKYAKLAAQDLTSHRRAASMFQQALGRAAATEPALIDLSSRYPLLDPRNLNHPDHTVVYCNAVYNARQAGQSL